MKNKGLRIPGGIKDRLPSESFADFLENLKRDHPSREKQIDDAVASYKDVMSGGGISIEEVKDDLHSLFAKGSEVSPTKAASPSKGRNNKR